MPGTAGSREFLATKLDMLYRYKLAKQYTSSHIVRVEHGNVAESAFRLWLEEFLPKKFGVCRGFIVSQKKDDTLPLPHFDVIIYDKMEAPTLWIENNVDHAPHGRSRGIPVEYVRAVIEVKSSLTPKSSADAVKKICELLPFSEKTDAPGEKYRCHLPHTFCACAIFFEIKRDDAYSAASLSSLLPAPSLNQWPRGYFGAYVLEGDGIDKANTGRIDFVLSQTNSTGNISKDKVSLLSPDRWAGPDSVKYTNDMYIQPRLTWATAFFADFAFDLLARMNGTYQPGIVSSFHGARWMGREDSCI